MTMLEPSDPTTRAPAVRAEGGRRALAAVADRPVVEPRDVAHADGGPPQACQTPPDAGSCHPAWSSDWLQLGHELRTPLNAILGNIELLLDGSAGPLSAPARACIGDIQMASRQLMDQLQPLLLLVQARTSAAPGPALALDLLELIRRASADRKPAAPDRSPEEPHGPCLMPSGVRLMIPGDPVWLGALAAALVDLHAAARGRVGAMSVELEHNRHQIDDMTLRVTWDGFEPGGMAPLSLALVDAVLQLHAGRIRSLNEQGLRLDLPTARVEPAKTAVERAGR